MSLGHVGHTWHFSKFQWFFKNRVLNFLKKIKKVPRGNVFKSIHANFHEDWSSGGSTNRGYLSAQFPTWDPCPPRKGGPKNLNFRISNLQRVHNSLGILADWKKNAPCNMQVNWQRVTLIRFTADRTASSIIRRNEYSYFLIAYFRSLKSWVELDRKDNVHKSRLSSWENRTDRSFEMSKDLSGKETSSPSSSLREKLEDYGESCVLEHLRWRRFMA